MSPRSVCVALVAVLLVSFQLLLLAPPTAAITVREQWRQSQLQRSQGNRQWGDMGFPYFMMMMNSSNLALPSVWLVPLVAASCVLLFIRDIVD